jgi:hypothetical protein
MLPDIIINSLTLPGGMWQLREPEEKGPATFSGTDGKRKERRRLLHSSTSQGNQNSYSQQPVLPGKISTTATSEGTCRCPGGSSSKSDADAGAHSTAALLMPLPGDRGRWGIVLTVFPLCLLMPHWWVYCTRKRPRCMRLQWINELPNWKQCKPYCSSKAHKMSSKTSTSKS